MSPDGSTTAAVAGLPRRAFSRRRLARLTQWLSAAAFMSAAAAVLGAGALHAAGRTGPSSLLATVGYALGIAGIGAGVFALVLDSDDTPKETP